MWQDPDNTPVFKVLVCQLIQQSGSSQRRFIPTAFSWLWPHFPVAYLVIHHHIPGSISAALWRHWIQLCSAEDCSFFSSRLLTWLELTPNSVSPVVRTISAVRSILLHFSQTLWNLPTAHRWAVREGFRQVHWGFVASIFCFLVSSPLLSAMLAVPKGPVLSVKPGRQGLFLARLHRPESPAGKKSQVHTRHLGHFVPFSNRLPSSFCLHLLTL